MQQLTEFFKAIEGDGRIAPIHICVYVALLHYRSINDLGIHFNAFSYEIMAIAKIANKATYYKAIKALSEYGYLHITTTRKKNKGSYIHLCMVEYRE